MKKVIAVMYRFIVLACIVIFSSFLSSNDKDKFAPPGTVKVSERIFIDESEVSNIDWREFLYWIKRDHGKSSEIYLRNRLDSSVLASVFVTPHPNGYSYGVANDKYPVVGVSYEQAQEYCEWRTKVVQLVFEMRRKENPKAYVPKKFRYRLPTKEEWELVAKAGPNALTLKKIKKKVKKLQRYRRKGKYSHGKDLKSETQITMVKSYYPNIYGVYNINDNVSEMTSIKGVAKGKNWKNGEKEFSYDREIQYEGAQNWLGFRCVCEILEE